MNEPKLVVYHLVRPINSEPNGTRQYNSSDKTNRGWLVVCFTSVYDGEVIAHFGEHYRSTATQFIEESNEFFKKEYEKEMKEFKVRTKVKKHEKNS